MSDAWTRHYSYHFNEWDTFYRMLFRLRDARAELQSFGSNMSVTQLGDLLDLWRNGEATHPDDIIADNVHLIEMLYSHPDGLLAPRLVGNHDHRMVGAPGWFLRLFFPSEAAGAWGVALHGDWFDTWLHDILPDWLQEFVVLMAGRLPQAEKYPLGKMQQCMTAQSAAAGGFKDWIELPEGATLGGLAAVAPAFPDELNVARASRPPPEGLHPFLPHAARVLDTMRQQPDAGKAWSSARVVVVGHTHHARISVDDSDPARPVVLMDCGAWIESYKSADGTAGPNCQLGVIAGNDLRIYQLDRSA